MEKKKTLRNIKIIENKEIYLGYYLLSCEYESLEIDIKPGNFLNIYLQDGVHLAPRPFCVFDISKSKIQIFYEVKGEGTKILSSKKPGESLSVLIPLGNNFPFPIPDNLYLLAGGMGIAPIFYLIRYLAKHYSNQLKNTKLYYGAMNKDHLFFLEQLKDTGCEVIVATDNGDSGFKGNCLDKLKNDVKESGLAIKNIFACGPVPMLKAISKYSILNDIESFISMESVMGCGFGACMGCVQKVKKSEDKMPYRLVCSDGPVFNAKEIDWS